MMWVIAAAILFVLFICALAIVVGLGSAATRYVTRSDVQRCWDEFCGR